MEPNPYKAPAHFDPPKPSYSRVSPAWRAVRRASWFAVPVMGIGGYGMWSEAAYAARYLGRDNWLEATVSSVFMTQATLGVWLGCAAFVGWLGGAKSDAARLRDDLLSPPEPSFPWEPPGMSTPGNSHEPFAGRSSGEVEGPG